MRVFNYKKHALWSASSIGGLLWLISIVKALANRLATGYTDSAGFMELMSRSGLVSPLKSYYFTSSVRVASLYGEHADKICSLIPNEYSDTRSVIGGHPYLISIFGSVASWLTNLGPHYISAIALIMSSLLGLFAVIIFLTKNNVPKQVTALLVLGICLYPVFTQSLLGQAYFDRLLFGPAIAAFLLVRWTKHHSFDNWKIICFFTFTLALISERGAALAGLISVGYLFLLHGKNVFLIRELRFVLVTGALSLIWLQIWSRVWQNYAAYNQISISSWWSRLEFLINDPSTTGLKTFVLMSLFFLLLSLFSGFSILPLIICLLPNLLIGTGGAELTGFTTHYHQVYLPILLASGAIGVVTISKFLDQRLKSRNSRSIQILFMLSLVFLMLNFSFDTSPSVYRAGPVRDSQAVWMPFVLSVDKEIDTIRKRQMEISDYVSDLVPTAVSASEGMYPSLLLSGVKIVEYWPFGVGSADVVLAPYSNSLPNVLPFADPQGSTAALQKCVQENLDTNYQLKKVFDGDLRIYIKR